MQIEILLMYMMQATLKIQSNGPNTVDHADFPDTENIGSFALYKNFTLFEIVNELVSKEEPLYFNPSPPTLQETLRKRIQEKRHTTFKGKCNKEVQVSFQIIH
jgi:hypothetical protein